MVSAGTRSPAYPIKTKSLFKDRTLMKKTLRGAIVLAAGIAVAACVKQAWQVTYPGPENYSVGTAVLVAENGTSYMAGFIDPQTLFVAAYNANGQKLWDQRLSGDGFSSFSYGRTLALDKGTLYLISDNRTTLSVTLFKLKADTGEVLLQRDLENSVIASNFQLGADGQLYLNSSFSGSSSSSPVIAYSADGEFLWEYPAPRVPFPSFEERQKNVPSDSSQPSNSDDTLLLQSRAAAAGGNASDGSSGWIDVQAAVLQGGLIFLHTSSTITALDSNGNVIASQSSANLGFTNVTSMIAHGDKLLVIGSTTSATESVVLNLDLTEHSRSTLSTELGTTIKVRSSGNDTCALLNNTSTLQLMQLDASGAPLWIHPLDKPSSVFEIVGEWLLADQGACYYSTTHYSSRRLNTYVDRYNGPGESTDHFTLTDFAPMGVVVQGKSIYHVGITGPFDEATQQYDDSITIAALNKQTRK
ncbi:Hypothetical protein HDN1F_25010 [gamma proteobacterium HdN1]|nr:Hypothetical protein HDN1F_25010 [gamma proteobacterium HdN1]